MAPRRHAPPPPCTPTRARSGPCAVSRGVIGDGASAWRPRLGTRVKWRPGLPSGAGQNLRILVLSASVHEAAASSCARVGRAYAEELCRLLLAHGASGPCLASIWPIRKTTARHTISSKCSNALQKVTYTALRHFWESVCPYMRKEDMKVGSYETQTAAQQRYNQFVH